LVQKIGGEGRKEDEMGHIYVFGSKWKGEGRNFDYILCLVQRGKGGILKLIYLLILLILSLFIILKLYFINYTS
jgi:hypothetical protein